MTSDYHGLHIFPGTDRDARLESASQSPHRKGDPRLFALTNQRSRDTLPTATMSYYPSIEDSASYFAGNARGFPSVKEDPDKTALDPMAWAPRSPALSDFPQFSMAQAKAHPGLSTGFAEPQYSAQYLSPISHSGLHSPHMDNEPYDPMGSSWNAYAMPSPAPEYDMNSFTQQDPPGYESFCVNPSQVQNISHYAQTGFDSGDSSTSIVKQESDMFPSAISFSGGFPQTLSSNHVMSGVGDSVMAGAQSSTPGPYMATHMDIDRGAPATPPEEDNSDTARPRRPAISRKRNPKEVKSTPRRPKPSRPASGTSRNVRCKSCDESFLDAGLLQDHVQQAHARPLVCVFGYAGCTATFGSKNEWKRHTLSQHIILTYWLCTDEECVRANPRTGGTVFNRKDLYTQHVRRMHVPDMYKDFVARKEHHPDWDRMLRCMQDSAERKRCELPTYMKCPAPDCIAEFRGANAWDDRMEHVARHLDARSPGEPHVVFGGHDDKTLTDWAKRPDVNIVRHIGGDRWELVVPLKTTAKEAGSSRKLGASFRSSACDDEDAIGEPE